MNEQKKDFLDKLFSYPLLNIFVIGIITVFFAFQLPKAELDNNNIRFVPENDEARQTSAYIDETFGSSIFILVALERRHGDVFDAAFLNKIREFNSRMEEFEIVGNVNSIVSSDYIFAEGDSIIVQKLVREDFSGTPSEIAELRQRIFSWDIYRRALISDDLRATQILLPLTITNEQASRPEIINSFIEIRDIAREMFGPYADVYVTGIPIISATINEAMRSDLFTMIPIVVLVVLLILFLSFRKFTLVILPLITVLVAVVWSMGVMPLVGIKLSVVSTVLPVILVAVGSAYGIHVVTYYLEGVKNIAEMSREKHTALVLLSVRKIGKAVFITAVTTMAGFFAFCFTPVVPIREFGFFASFGVLVSFLMAITLIPSLLIIRGPRLIKTPAEKSSIAIVVDTGIVNFFSGITRKKGTVIFLVVVVLLFSAWGMSQVIIDNVFVEYFRPTTDIYRSDHFVREKFGGSKIVSVVVKADTTETLLMPEVLVAMDGLGTYLEERVPEVGKVMCFTDLIKRINQVFNADESPDGLRPRTASFGNEDSFGFGFGDFGFGDFAFGSAFGSFEESEAMPGFQETANEPETISAAELVRLLREAVASGKDRFMDANDLVRAMERLINFEGAAYYEVPSDPARYGMSCPTELQQLVANYLILLSGNISSYANDPLSPTAIKTTVQLRTVGDEDTARAIDRIRRYIDDNFPKTVETIIGGTALIESSLNRLVVRSQLISIVISIIIIFFILMLANRSFIAGIVIVAPLSICLLINFAVMGFAGIKLNIGTSMMACLCLGIGIDYTIHYVEAYRRECLAAGEKENFLPKTFAVTGKAILINAVSVGAGFAVLLFSQFVMLQDLGFLIALAMASSALVSLTVIPVLLSLIKPKFIHKELINE